MISRPRSRFSGMVWRHSARRARPTSKSPEHTGNHSGPRPPRRERTGDGEATPDGEGFFRTPNIEKERGPGQLGVLERYFWKVSCAASAGREPQPGLLHDGRGSPTIRGLSSTKSGCSDAELLRVERRFIGQFSKSVRVENFVLNSR